MILRIVCPSGHVLDVDAQLSGRKIRCGACGKIMLVPRMPKGPPPRPAARPIARPAAKPLAKPQAPPPSKPLAPPTAPPPPKPIVAPLPEPPSKPLVAPLPEPPSKRPTAEPPTTPPPDLPRDEGMVALPLPPPQEPEPVAAEDEETVGRRSAARVLSAWLRKLWPAAETQIPSDATAPGEAERRMARRLAAVPAVAALVGLLPVLGHANLLTAPPWVLAVVLLAVLQWAYAAWLVNAPDWVSARVQMIVCAVVATLYAIAMTWTIFTPVNQSLILGLGEIRRKAPAWCGLMLLLMGAATWFCGRASTKWRRDSLPQDEQ